MAVVIVSSADLMKPGESLAAEDWIGRAPGETLQHFRNRREIARLEAVNQRARAQVAKREQRIDELRSI